MMRSVDAVVIGAGLCGLTTAYHLTRQGHEVLLVEASDSIGGVIQSHRAEGFLLEAGPHTFPSSAYALIDLCKQLNLQPVTTAEIAKNRYVWHQQTLYPLPGNPFGFFRSSLLSPWGKLRLLLEPLIPKTRAEDESLAQFARRRLGEEAMEKLLAPFVSGIYAGDIEQLSYPAVFPRLAGWERAHGSIFSGAMAARKNKPKSQAGSRYQLMSFEDGMATLPRALAEALPASSLLTGNDVREIHYEDALYRLTLASGETIRSRSLVLATPADVTARLLSHFLPDVAHLLEDIPYAPLVVAHMGFHRSSITRPLDGFGFLSTRSSGSPFLGAIWTSSLFPQRAPQGQVLLSCFLGGACHPEVIHFSDRQIVEQVRTDLAQVFQRPELHPTFVRLFRYKRAIPQYNLGHGQRIARIQAGIQLMPGLALTGNSLQGVSLNDCAHHAMQTAQATSAFLAQRNGISVS